MQYSFYTADVFTDRPFGGNPLAVFPQAQGLSSAQMQQIAQEFNLSETVFVLPPETPQGTRRLRIFTPGREIPFAGHPTVGTAYVLATIGEIPLTAPETTIVFEEEVGPVPVMIRTENGKPVFSQLSAAKMPQLGPPPPALEQLAATVSLPPEALHVAHGPHSHCPQAWSCGVPFLFIPLRDRQALAQAQLNPSLWQEHLAAYWAPDVYLFCFDPEQPGSDLRSRMFAPSMNIREDPATGAAATALAGYLGSRAERATGTLHWQVEQGFEMGRPSLLAIEADTHAGAIVAVRVGGASVLVSQGTLGPI
jgi:trans-2,3-dihydro-3-hydroxyanthranilate isomerase